MQVVVNPTIQESDDFIDSKKPIFVDNVQIHKEKTIRFLGKDIDLKSLYISILAIISSILIWYYTDILSDLIVDNNLLILFSVLIINFIAQIFTSSISAGSITLEQSKLLAVNQINSLLIGTILVFIFIMKIHTDTNTKIFSVATILIIMNLLNSMNLSVRKNGSSIRTLRKIKEVFLNISITLFASLVYISMKV
jgi:hypothetical protein